MRNADGPMVRKKRREGKERGGERKPRQKEGLGK